MKMANKDVQMKINDRELENYIESKTTSAVEEEMRNYRTKIFAELRDIR